MEDGGGSPYNLFRESLARLETLFFLIGKPLLFFLTDVGVIVYYERHAPIRPADVFIYSFWCAVITLFSLQLLPTLLFLYVLYGWLMFAVFFAWLFGSLFFLHFYIPRHLDRMVSAAQNIENPLNS